MNSSKNKKRSQAAAAGALMLAIMLTVSACGDNKQIPGNASNTEPPIIDQMPQGSGIIDSGAANKDDSVNEGQTGNNTNNNEANNTEKTDTSKQDQEEVHTVQGEYVGLQDSNQVEIVTANGAEAFRLTDQVRPIIDTLEPDAKVEISYTVEVIEKDTGLKHLWLQSIKVVE